MNNRPPPSSPPRRCALTHSPALANLQAQPAVSSLGRIEHKDNPADIPPDWHVEGQHLLYAVGPDGVDVGKQMSGRFCGDGEKTGLIKQD